MNYALKQRTAALFIAFCLLYFLIVINLFFLQIINAQFFSSLAHQQHGILVEQHGPRAPILDRYGNYLAMNKEVVSAFITPHNLKEPEKVFLFLQEHYPQAYQRVLSKKAAKFMFIKRRLTEDEQSKLAGALCSDFHFIREQGRFYPLDAAAPLVGTTDIDNHGLLGIELLHDVQLRGDPTCYYIEKDARSGYFYFKYEERKAGKKSDPLQLSIDSTLQFLVDQEVHTAQEHWNAVEVAAVIIDPQTGHIRAMANAPRFNPQEPIHDLALTKNISIAHSYELGSVIKVFTALAALQEGVVTADELIDCKNCTTYHLDGRKVNTWKAHGLIPFTEVIARSNNIGIAQIAKRLDTKLYDHFMRLGFGKKTGVGLPGETPGFVQHPAQWSKQSVISLSYGYEIAATLLQLACAFCIIANDGKAIQPTILYAKKSTPSEQLYDTPHICAIKEILKYTTEHGTSHRSKIRGYDIMCKTGTTNLLINGTYQPDRHAFTCAGIVQKGSYQRVLVVFVKDVEQKNLYASQVAAPLFEQIAQKMIIHERIL